MHRSMPNAASNVASTSPQHLPQANSDKNSAIPIDPKFIKVQTGHEEQRHTHYEYVTLLSK